MINHKRIDWDEYFLNIAKDVASRSTCLRRNYGAVIVDKDHRIVATGYNGAARKEIDCLSKGICRREELNIPHGQNYELCLAGNTIIKLLNGTYKTLEELYNNKEEKFWVYSIDTETGKVVPAIAEKVIYKGVAQDAVKILLDNDAEIICTPEHLFLLRDCTYKKAKDLTPKDSLMPLYYTFECIDGEHEAIYNTISRRRGTIKKSSKCNTPKTVTHRLVYEFFHGEQIYGNDYLIHHKDHNKTNNVPDNLEYIARGAHASLTLKEQGRTNNIAQHAYKSAEIQKKRLEADPDFLRFKQEIGSQNMSANWNNNDFREKMVDVNRTNGYKVIESLNAPDQYPKKIRGKILSGLNFLFSKMKNNNDKTPITEENYVALHKKYKSSGQSGPRVPTLKTILKYFDTFDEAIELAQTYNHKIKSIEKYTNISTDLYDIVMSEYHNFAIDLGDNSCIFVHNCCAVHAEANAIINCDPKYFDGTSTIYIYGYMADTGEMCDGTPCMMCDRMIKNARLNRVYYKDGGLTKE